MVLRAGSYAMGIREPGQDREVAALSGHSHVPWGSPEGAVYRSAPGSSYSTMGARSLCHFWGTFVRIGATR